MKNYEVLVTDLKRTEQCCLDSIAQGEHPEWHGYEVKESKVNSKIWESLMRKGCIRYGTSYNGRNLHFEGSPYALKKYMQKCKDFAEENGLEAHFDPYK